MINIVFHAKLSEFMFRALLAKHSIHFENHYVGISLKATSEYYINKL